MLRVRGLWKRYGDAVALDGVDLDIEPGEICALLGPNGAGKTTLVSIVAGLRRADAGSVAIGGIDAFASPQPARRLVGLAPQETGVYPTITVRENLRFFAELAELRGADAQRRVEEVAETLGLIAFVDRLVRTLSGGERRRLHTALAMLHRPPLLLLDEPTTGVDVATRSRLLRTVASLAATDGTAVCYSTHYLPEVEALGASLAILDRGQVIARGTLAELVAAHGASSLELTFDGEPPPVDLRVPVDRAGSSLRIRTDAPAAVLPSVLAALGHDVDRLTGVEILRPNLETVFLSLTGRRYGEDDIEAVPEVA